MAAQLKGNTGSAMLEFSLNLYKGCLDGDNNAFMSPFSVCAALLLADLGAYSDTELEIRKALGLDKLSQSEVHERYKAIQDSLNAQSKGSTTLETANRIFSCLGVTVDKGYAKDSEKYYGSGLELMDFKGDGEGSRQKINKWVEKKTRDKIRDLLPMGIIRADTLMVLVNAIYFKGKWLEPFEKRATRDMPFYVTKSNRTKVKMMCDEQEVRYVSYPDLKCTAVELPYQDGNVTMVLIRPDDVEGLRQLEASLTGSTFESLLSELSGTYKQDVDLWIPRFKMEATYALVPVLAALGITSMFDPAKSDFSKMLPDNPDAYVSAVFHKAFVEVQEQGTEAAAATAFVEIDSCRCDISEPPRNFILDRPFLFIIRDSPTDAVLFMGRYALPTFEPPTPELPRKQDQRSVQSAQRLEQLSKDKLKRRELREDSQQTEERAVCLKNRKEEKRCVVM